MTTSAAYRCAFCVHLVADREVSWPRVECSEHYQLAAADYHNSSRWSLAAAAAGFATGLFRALRAVRLRRIPSC